MTLRERLSELVHTAFSGIHIRSFEHDAIVEIAQLCRRQGWSLANRDLDRGLRRAGGSGPTGNAAAPLAMIRYLSIGANRPNATTPGSGARGHSLPRQGSRSPYRDAYALDPCFLRDLAASCRGLRGDFWLLGEAIHGDYRRVAGPGLLDVATNYECYKGLYSGHNDRNYFEIAHSLDRLLGAGGLYRGLTTYNYADNHDVDRVASVLRNPAHLYPLYLLLFTMPGVPSVYAGSEWGIEGVKAGGDDRPLRPALPSPAAAASLGRHPDLAPAVARFAAIRRGSAALRRGTHRQLHVAPEQLAFEREGEGERVVVAANAAGAPARLEIPVAARDGAAFEDRLGPGGVFEVRGGRLRVAVPPCWGRILARR